MKLVLVIFLGAWSFFSGSPAIAGGYDIWRKGGDTIINTERKSGDAITGAERKKQAIEDSAQRRISALQVQIDANDRKIYEELDPQLREEYEELRVLERDYKDGTISQNEYVREKREANKRVDRLRNSIHALKEKNYDKVELQNKIRADSEREKRSVDMNVDENIERVETQRNTNILQQLLHELVK